MSNIWIFSDPHYGHENIVRGCTKWEDKSACRNFDTLEEHNTVLVENINKQAKEDDIIFCIGDFALGGKDNVFEFRKQLGCKNIHLIYGNHDLHIMKNYNNCQSLFKSCNIRLQRKIGKQSFVMDHYSMRTWDKGHKGSIMLYGHSHGSLEEYSTMIEVGNEALGIKYQQKKYFKTMDVGIDTRETFNMYHLDEVLKIMETRIPLIIDHHLNND